MLKKLNKDKIVTLSLLLVPINKDTTNNETTNICEEIVITLAVIFFIISPH